ncbi:TPA: hypothetical protein QCN90_001082 [Bacillus pacificus]|nr:hypothetical protein [Bacillus pacificus]
MEFTKWQLELLYALVSEKEKETYELGNTKEGVEVNNRFFKAFPEGLGDEDNIKALSDKLEAALQSK